MPPVNPTLGPESPLCLTLFSVLPTQKAFLKNSVQSLSRTLNQTTLFCCLWLGMDCRQLLISFGNKTSAQKVLRTSYLRTFLRSSSSCLRSSSMHLLASMYSCQEEMRKATSKQWRQCANAQTEYRLIGNTSRL